MSDKPEWRNRIVGHGEVDPKELIAHPKNWRRHPRAQKEALNGILAEVGWVGSVLVNKTTGRIVDGHARVELAVSRHEQKVPVDYVELTEAEETLVLATLDPIGELARTDDANLADLIQQIDTGDEALQALLGQISPSENEERTDDAANTPSEQLRKEYGTDVGQLWELDGHRLIIGDSSDATTYERLMGNDRADMLFTDPPYGVSYQSRNFEVIKNDERTGDDLVKFLRSLLAPAMRYLKPEAAAYVWHASSTRREFSDALRSVGLEEKQYLIWVKPTPVLGHADYHWAHEPCFYCARAGMTPQFYGDRTNSTVWRTAAAKANGCIPTVIGNGLLLSDGNGRTLYVTTKAPKGKKVRAIRIGTDAAYLVQNNETDDVWEVDRVSRPEHPTDKPPELARRACENSTMPGQIVLDICAGGGSTMIGAHQTGRYARLIELDPGNAAVILDRGKRLGLTPKLLT